MSRRTLTRVLTLTMTIPHTPATYHVRIPARSRLAARCAHELRQFAQRHAVPVSYVDYATQWGA